MDMFLERSGDGRQPRQAITPANQFSPWANLLGRFERVNAKRRKHAVFIAGNYVAPGTAHDDHFIP